MKVTNIKNKIISVLGMPHSGTTILSNTLNSMDNGFCLSEPHWTLQTKPFKLRFDKIDKIPMTDANSVLGAIRARLEHNKVYDFGGVKETYRPRNAKMAKSIDKIVKESDIVFFIFREPKALMNNFKKIPGNHMPMERLLYVYNKLIETANGCDGAINVILEDFCDAGNKGVIEYLNSRCGDLLTIEGDFNLKPTNYLYGDLVANNSTHIKKANRNFSRLSKQEIAIIDRELTPKYKVIRKA